MLLATQLYSQTKSVKVLLDNGTTRYYPVGEVTKLTFEDDPCDGVKTITYSGKTYSTEQIGAQCWLAQNLNVGTLISTATDGDQTDNVIIEKYCNSNNSWYCYSFGGIYQWAEAVAYTNGATNTTPPSPALSGNIQGICPTGWHIPTITEFETLKTTVNSSSNTLKAVGQGTGAGDGTNISGFSALLAARWYNLFSNQGWTWLGSETNFWSSTEFSGNNAYSLKLNYNNDSISMPSTDKRDGHSVRCLKD